VPTGQSRPGGGLNKKNQRVNHSSSLSQPTTQHTTPPPNRTISTTTTTITAVTAVAAVAAVAAVTTTSTTTTTTTNHRRYRHLQALLPSNAAYCPLKQPKHWLNEVDLTVSTNVPGGQ
jgi:hypothetical protein